MTAVYSNPTHIRNIMTFCAPNLKAEYLTECLIEVLNNQWKVNAIESNRAAYHQLEMEIGRKYIKVWENFIRDGVKNDLDISRSCYMFVDKNTGKVLNEKQVEKLQKQLLDNWNLKDEDEE